MTTLYTLTAQYQALYEAELDDELFSDTLESLDEALEDKADGYAKVINQLKADELALAEEIKRLQEKKTAVQKKQTQLKQSLKNSMLLINRPKIKTTLFSFNIQKNPPSVEIDESKFMRSEFTQDYLVQQEPKIDRKKLITDLKAGREVAGAKLKQTEGLRIK